MSTNRDVDRIVRSWLDEGTNALPDRVLDAVLDNLPTTPQRRSSWTARRFSAMNNILRVGLAAAAVVVIAIVAINLLPGSPTSVGEPSASPSAEASVAAAPSPVLFWDAPGIGPIRVTIPGPSWRVESDNGLIGGTGQNEAGILVFSGDLWIYGDPCAWSATTPDTPATTADDIVAALAGQASRNASTPKDIAIGESAGQSITLHVPDDIGFDLVGATFPDCDQGYFGTLAAELGPDSTPQRLAQGPGQIEEFWVVDVGGVPVAFDLIYWPSTPQAVIDDLHAMVESATFGT